MSVRWSDAVWRESKAEGRTLLVLLALADHANDQGVSWPTLRGLASKARCTRQTVVQAIRWAEEHRELAVDRGGGRNHRNRYSLFPDKYPNGLPTRPPKRSSEWTAKRSSVDRNGLPLSAAERPHTPNRQPEPSLETVRTRTADRSKPTLAFDALTDALQGRLEEEIHHDRRA